MTPEQRVDVWADSLVDRTVGLLGGLEAIGDAFLQLGDQPRRDELHVLREPLLALVHGCAPLCHGAGVAVVPGRLAGTGHWLEWWTGRSDGGEFGGHLLDAEAVNFYDYTEMPWFQEPLATGRPDAFGPYLDNGGTDLRIVTLAVPVLRNGEPVGVAGADLLLSELERDLLEEVGLDPAVALVSGSGRVIATNSPSLAGRSVLRGDARAERVLRSLEMPPATTSWRLCAV